MNLWLPDEAQKNTEKGHIFERLVAETFASNSKYFTIEDWSADNHNKTTGIKVEANQNPDLVIRYNPTGERFAVECKYRTNPSISQKNGGPVISWAKPYQIENYKAFSNRRRIPVFVVIGLGGKPDDPDIMYCLPLEEARFPDLFFSLLNNYEKEPGSGFFWRDGILR
ncbi:MAG: hypothetical protein J0L53_10665 [Spirochaetes bacterium]|nr:hypothetical protein [Spirochaetota bacterium]MBX3720497.1 hypothetical protein [Turneriella sp.]